MKKNETFEKGNILALYPFGVKEYTKAIMYFANGTLTLLLINRWIVSGHFPLSNLYESLIFLSWSFATIYSITSFTLPSTILPVLGSSIAPITLLTCAFAFFCVPQELQKSQSLVPALQSNWLIMHVSVMILSYASLLLGSLFALTLLLTERISKQKFKKQSPPYSIAPLLQKSVLPSVSFASKMHGKGHWAQGVVDVFSYPFSFAIPLLYPVLPSVHGVKRDMGVASSEGELHSANDQPVSILPSLSPKRVPVSITDLISSKPSKETIETNPKKNNLLDNISYRFIGLGFALLTLGIISGAVWANFAWGSYWSWDPKETWAFITWLTYAFYLHLRISKGWYGKQSAFVAIFGFFVVWFCYLGVNLFGKGLHSYAFV